MKIPNYPFTPIKLGFSCEPDRRVKEFTKGPFPSVLLGTWPAPNGISDESEIHVRFRKDRLHGEWFRPSEELKAYLASVGVSVPGAQIPRRAQHIPDPFDFGSLAYSRLSAFIADLKNRWPRVGPQSCLLKAQQVADLTGLATDEIRRLVIPVRLGGVRRYAFVFVKEFFEQNPQHVSPEFRIA